MKKLSLAIAALGTLFLMTACSGNNNSNPTPVGVQACTTNGVYNPTGAYYPNGSQYPYGVPGTTGCAGVPGGYNPALAGQYGYNPALSGQYGYGAGAYGSNPCAVYNNGYQMWTLSYYGGQPVCISNF
jgi:hypothetical protein